MISQEGEQRGSWPWVCTWKHCKVLLHADVDYGGELSESEGKEVVCLLKFNDVPEVAFTSIVRHTIPSARGDNHDTTPHCSEGAMPGYGGIVVDREEKPGIEGVSIRSLHGPVF